VDNYDVTQPALGWLKFCYDVDLLCGGVVQIGWELGQRGGILWCR